MQSRVKMLMVVIGLLFCSGLTLANPSAYTGVVSVDSVQVHGGDHFSVAVRLTNNNISFAALFVPLKFPVPGLVLDSVSL